MASPQISVRIDPELRAALEAVAANYKARGIRVGLTSILRRAASLGMAYVEREARGGNS
jgi:hypothetical protein